eukprot:TRINITY_DN1239_c0_g1_i1.p1 TRINITY_DN1239_c0_g1~~TRINITY_DN1239_c0_g1_i1.p1  ORF type:complete len:220 (+),score=41.58 TRINITY_DN1239_c0_g1_i1:494-1153(+)
MEAKMCSSRSLLLLVSFLALSATAENPSSPLPVCLDDSDCVQHGNKYACFKYFCYPWKDDSDVGEPYRRQTCREDSECSEDHVCFRHHDIRSINRGLCLDNILLEDCEIESDCGPGFGCCGGLCCEMEYHMRFADLPCVSDLGCQDLGMGKYCCPRDNSSSICCDTDPNPTTTPLPIQSPATGSGQAMGSSYRLIFASAAGSYFFLSFLGRPVFAFLLL